GLELEARRREIRHAERIPTAEDGDRRVSHGPRHYCVVHTNAMTVRLTKTAKRAGCAAKHPPGFLFPLIGALPKVSDPNVLVGSSTADDAAIYRLDDETALVLTTDFFTPIVDDPYDFGRVAA